MPGALKPNVVEAHAMELIKSMLYLADTSGQSLWSALQTRANLMLSVHQQYCITPAFCAVNRILQS